MSLSSVGSFPVEQKNDKDGVTRLDDDRNNKSNNNKNNKKIIYYYFAGVSLASRVRGYTELINNLI